MLEAPFSTKEKVLVYLAAEGFSIDEIAPLVALPLEKVSSMMTDQNMQLRVRELRSKLYSKDANKNFSSMLGGAQDVLKSVLENPNEKTHIRVQVAQEVFDRALGKPKQTIEHEGSMLRSLFEKMDQNGQIIEAEFKEVLPALSNPNSSNQEEFKNPNLVDPIDDWVNKNT